MSSPRRPSAAPGWYADATRSGTQRYFDGVAWTCHTAPLPATNHIAPPVTSTAWAPQSYPAFVHDARTAPTDPVHWLLPVGRTWQSIAAGYVALFALLIWPLGPFALGLGIAALNASAHGRGRGRGRAYFAIAVGSLATLGMVTIFVVNQ